MQDSGNIIMKDKHQELCLYSHLKGAKLPSILKRALKKGRSRWDDYPYLSRIVFCEMLSAKELRETSGFGISVISEDADRDDIIVDVEKKQVKVSYEKDPQSFEDFCK